MSNELDIGPLSWVKDEIELALGRASELLQEYAARQDASVLSAARASLHQSHGALAVVGLDGVIEFSRAIERLLEAIARGEMPWAIARGELTQEAIVALRQYLDELIAGRPNQPLRLLPVYRRLNEAGGNQKTIASDLFFPDLSQRPPRREGMVPADERTRAARLKAARLGFERGMSKWTKGDASGIRDMRNSIAIIEAQQELPATRAFWWVTLAWFDALAAGGIADADAARRLCERIDAQVKKPLDGAETVAERLMRDVLYEVAKTRASSEHIEMVRASYRLRDLMPAQTAADDPRAATLAAMRQLLGPVAENWDQFCSGAAVALPRFHEQSAELLALAQQLGNVDLSRLVAALANTANVLRKNPLVSSDALAVELETALLLVDEAINRFPGLDIDFAGQVDALTSRLNALQRGEELSPSDLPALRAVAQRAAGRLSIHRESLGLGAELQQVEQALDAYFQDEGNARGLDDAISRLNKIEGLFAQIDQPQAADLAGECARCIEALSTRSPARQPGEFEEIARKISALGFFVAQLPHGAADLDALLASGPISVPAGSAATTPGSGGGEPVQPTPTSAAADAELLEVFIEEARQTVDAVAEHLARSMANPNDAESLSALRSCFHTLKGSSGMVGLADFSDAMRAVESALAHRLQSGNGATAQMHAVVETANRLVTDWIDRVQHGGGAPDVTQLRRLCDAIPGPVRPTAAAPRELAPDPAPPAVPARAAQDLRPLFFEECEDLIPAATQSFREWRRGGENGTSGAASLQRILHTLKGSARMAGMSEIGEAIHGIESRIAEASLEPAPVLIDELETAFDHVAGRIDALRTVPAGVSGDMPRPMLRLHADLLDAMVNESGEIAIARSRIEGSVKSQRASLADLTENIARLRAHLRELEIQAEARIQSHTRLADEPGDAQFDPLEMDRFTRLQELTRILAESVNDVATVEHGLLRDLDQVDAALTQQARMSRELTQRLMGVRMMPFASIAERLRRVVRMTAEESGKRVAFSIAGGETELDRSVLERMTAPIEHLLRNAVVHGIEPSGKRAAAGKPALGEVRLALAQAGNELAISVADDGGGLDLARIRTEAVKRGLLRDGETASDAELSRLVYLAGFTTAALSANAGRGVGMDVVRNEATALGGRVEAHSQTGKGTTFTLHLPLTLAVIPAVLVKAGEVTFGIPASMVMHASEMKAEAMVKIRAAAAMEWQGQRYVLHYLPHLFGNAAARPAPQRRHWVLLLRGGAQHIALELDGLVGNEEIVIKNTGPQIARVPGISGATVLADGEVVLIVNPITLIHARDARGTLAVAPRRETKEEPNSAAPTVMVVDDSITVRKITGRLLDRAGYRVVTAKDGVDAMEQLAELVPAVMLADIEMPRMDGFELVRRLRADNRFKSLPVIMITSRIADKHRAYAHELGVNHYLGKPYDEQQLLALVAECMKRC